MTADKQLVPVTTTPVRAVQVDTVTLRAVSLEGLEALRESDFAATIAPWLGKTLDGSEQAMFLQELRDVARRRGYPLTTVMIPEQTDAGGVLRIKIDEGRISGVRFSTTPHPLVESIFDGIADGMPLSAARLTRALRLAESVPGLRVRKAELVQEQHLNVLVVTLETTRAAATLVVDNWGTGPLGPVLGRVRSELRGLVRPGDQLGVSFSTNPLEPNEYANVSSDYTVFLGSSGLRLGIEAGAARSRVAVGTPPARFRGNGFRMGASLAYPLLLGRTSRLEASVGISLRDTETIESARLVRSDRVTLVEGQLRGHTLVGTGYLVGRIGVAYGPGWFGATREGTPLASRRDGSARFAKLEARAAIDQRLVGPVSVAFDAEAQIASRPLLSGDEFGIGGASFGRGYDFREAAGDNALAGAVEVRFDLAKLKLPVRRAQLYGYADAAHVWDLRGGGSTRLHSAGGGVRTTITDAFGVSIEVGVPLDRRIGARGSFSAWLRF